jgi:hypothetical protein
MGQGSYVLLLIVLTVVMAATLVAFAIAFDTYVESDDVFANLKLQGITSDIIDAKMPTLVTQLERSI